MSNATPSNKPEKQTPQEAPAKTPNEMPSQPPAEMPDSGEPHVTPNSPRAYRFLD